MLRDLRQYDLAKKAKLQPSAVSHFETGVRKPSFDNLCRLADALEVTVDFLMGRTDDPTPVGVGSLDRDYSKLTAVEQEIVREFLKSLARRHAKNRN